MANDDVHYEGETKNGNYHGHGTLSWVNEDGTKFLYEGEFKNGDYHGHGTLSSVSEDGRKSIYEGEFKNDKYHGHGTQKIGEGTYEGEFVDGMEYEGEFKNGNFHGHGKLNYGKTNYTGEFVDGLQHGTGSAILENQDWFLGKSTTEVNGIFQFGDPHDVKRTTIDRRVTIWGLLRNFIVPPWFGWIAVFVVWFVYAGIVNDKFEELVYAVPEAFGSVGSEYGAIYWVVGGIFLLLLLLKGIIGTFKRQPVVAILCLIFLFPIYLIWAFIEIFTYKKN